MNALSDQNSFVCRALTVMHGSFLLCFSSLYKFSFLIVPQFLMLEITMGVVNETLVMLTLIHACEPSRYSFSTRTRQLNIILFCSMDKIILFQMFPEVESFSRFQPSEQPSTCLIQHTLLPSNSVNPLDPPHIKKNPSQYYTLNFLKF